MKIGQMFCVDGIENSCITLRHKGCKGCKRYIPYMECDHCGNDSTYTSIGDDGLCMSCRILEEEE